MSMVDPHTQDQVTKTVVDIASVGIVGGSLLGWLPATAAVLTIIWTSIRIYETQTVQGWLNKQQTPGEGTEK